MPVLHKYVDDRGYYILTSINGHVISFQLTAAGYKKLKEAGIVPGQKFSRFLLLDLYRSRDAYTHGSGVSGPEVIPGQGVLDFDKDPEPETLFPHCSLCSSIVDLNLVEIKNENPLVEILCFNCRAKKLASIDSSIPLSLLTRSTLKRFLTMKQIEQIDEAVDDYQKFLDMEFEEKWAQLKRKKKPVQGTLPGNQPGDQLPLGGDHSVMPK